MVSDQFSAAVRALLREHLTSFEQLEILLLLCAPPHETWHAQAVSDRTRIPIDLALDALVALESHQLIRRIEGKALSFVFAPRDAGLRQAVEELAVLYREQRAAVMSVMSVNAIERIRSGTLRAFADSFVFGKKKGDPDG